MSSPGGSFLVNLGKGLAGSYLSKQEQERALNKEKEEKQFRLLEDAFNTAEKRGDTSAMAHIFRSMEEFTSASGQGRGGKSGRQQQQGILSVFADAIENGVQTPSSKEATSRNEELVSQGTPEALQQATRPRKALTPLFKSNETLEEEQTQTLVKREEALRPGKIKLYQEQQKAQGERQAKIEGMKATSRQDILNSTFKQRAELDVNKVISSLMAKNPDLTFEEARLEAGNQISLARQANLDHITSKIEKAEADIKLNQDRLKAQIDHWKVVEAQNDQRIAQGDVRNAQSEQRIQLTLGQAKTIQEEINVNQQEMIGLVIQQNNERRIMSNSYTSDAERAAAQERYLEQEKQYDQRMAKVRELLTKQEELKSSLSEEYTSAPSPKVLNKKQGKSLNRSSALDSFAGGEVNASDLPAMAAARYPNDPDGVNKIRKRLGELKINIKE